MGYYFDHQEEIEAEIEAEWKEAEQAKAAAPRSAFFRLMRAQGLLQK